jgi:hypothetical protein
MRHDGGVMVVMKMVVLKSGGKVVSAYGREMSWLEESGNKRKSGLVRVRMQRR